MEKIKWCCRVKNGIRLVDVSERIVEFILKVREY